MVIKPVNAKLVPIALDEVSTSDFERFGQCFYGGLVGKKFVPLGGMHDGGAEGFLEPEIFEANSTEHFLQISKQETARAKIRQTVNRLREFGRKPSSLVYLTSRTIDAIDREEELLSDELSCRIRIRDGKYIESNINSSEQTIACFDSYLRPFLAHLAEAGSADLASRASIYSDKTLAVFLRQEVENRRGKTGLLESVSDSLIIWSLSETDPDKGKFLTRDQILEKIENTLPSAKAFIRGVLNDRLSKLSSKSSTQGREVRHYVKDDRYCLPFSTRKIIFDENIEDISIKNSVSDAFKKRFHRIASDNERGLADDVVVICHNVLERVFEKQGLQVAQFAVDGDTGEEIFANIADLITEIVEELNFGENNTVLRRLAGRVLRGTFYDTTDDERIYLEKLSKTYVLLLLLKNEPKVVEYFRNLSANFQLYIGTDILVRALSEHYLETENQMTQGLLRILHRAGSKLILTEKAVEELASHLRAQILEFENVYMHVENKINLESVEYIDRIILRSYFYARLDPVGSSRPPQGFRSYIEQFGSYADIRAERGAEALARYLITKFGMEYETVEEMTYQIDNEKVSILAGKIADEKTTTSRPAATTAILAYNDALQVYRVYEKRRLNKESSPLNPFGFNTWWLTQDGGVRRASSDVVLENKSKKFMMRPEFVLNFISLAPSEDDVEASFGEIFPSLLGVKLSNRVESETFRRVIKSANEIYSVDEARASALISEFTEALKGDNIKRYENEWLEPH